MVIVDLCDIYPNFPVSVDPLALVYASAFMANVGKIVENL